MTKGILDIHNLGIRNALLILLFCISVFHIIPLLHIRLNKEVVIDPMINRRVLTVLIITLANTLLGIFCLYVAVKRVQRSTLSGITSVTSKSIIIENSSFVSFLGRLLWFVESGFPSPQLYFCL